MKFDDILKLKVLEEEAENKVGQALDKVIEVLGEFIKGFNVEVVGWGFAMERIEQPKGCSSEKDMSIAPGFYGIQTTILGRMKAHSEDVKKFGSIKIDILATEDKKFLKVTVTDRGNSKMDARFAKQLTEYIQGELELFQNVEVI